MENKLDIKQLPSVQFTQFSGTTKDLINMGEWFLYQVYYEELPQAKYYLETDKDKFFLKEDGLVIQKVQKTPDTMTYIASIKFNDLPQSEFVRNMSVLWA